MSLMKRNLISIVVESLLAIALILTSSPASAQADVQASQANQSFMMGRQTNQEAAGESVDEDETMEMKTEETPEPLLHEFLATAYCLRGLTSSGVRANPGSVAADPDVLPLGSIIRLHAGEHSGIYTVLDTGAKVRGRRLDIWFPSYEEAIEFGVRKVKVEIIRYGWDPTETEGQPPLKREEGG